MSVNRRDDTFLVKELFAVEGIKTGGSNMTTPKRADECTIFNSVASGGIDQYSAALHMFDRTFVNEVIIFCR